jgi:hypothetical protein
MCTQNTDCSIPCHPFFETIIDQANFTDCINAIDRVVSVIALCNALKLDEEQGVLSSDAAFGYYWVTILMRSALSYVRDRLVTLNRENEEKQEQESAYISSLFSSLSVLSDECRERLLERAALQMDVTQSDVGRFIENKIAGLTAVHSSSIQVYDS